MATFKLKEKTLKFQDMEVLVRQLTQGQRVEFVKQQSADKLMGPAIIASLGMVSPKWTVEQALEEPSDIVEDIVDAIMELSGMNKKDQPEKEPDAR